MFYVCVDRIKISLNLISKFTEKTYEVPMLMLCILLTSKSTIKFPPKISVICFSFSINTYKSFIYSETPKLLFYNDTDISKSSVRKMNLSQSKNYGNGLYQVSILLSKKNDKDPKFGEFDVCVSVAKMTS